MLADLYKPSLALVTDLYELTMAYGYWKSGLADRRAVFYLAFRDNPFEGGYAVACGLGTAADFLESLRFDGDDLAWLATLQGADEKPLFEPAFLDVLGQLRWTCDLDAVPEGTVVFAHEPLVRVEGPLMAGQIVESALLNIINFQTLVATKAARVVAAAQGDPVIEFGLRRAHGFDGALSASRAAYLGGCHATSNLLAGRLFGIPVKGTHAHSWVMAFDDELAAFRAYSEAMPGNAIFLVDTYDTLGGVRHAVQSGRRLREQGHEMLGIRLDSGDLVDLSIQARQILDQSGFPGASIVASGDLDEETIAALKQRGAAIDLWGVGTRLVTGHGDPALGGVYKLSAIRDVHGQWQDKAKFSETEAKSSTGGILQVRRYFDPNVRSPVFRRKMPPEGGTTNMPPEGGTTNVQAIGDVIYDVRQPPEGGCVMVELAGTERQMTFPADALHEDLLVPVFRDGRRVADLPSLAESRRRVREQLAMFSDDVKRLDAPTRYPVGLEIGISKRRNRLKNGVME